MAAGVVVTCPECEKKFKPKSDVQGKKIKCPFCFEPFVVPAAEDDEEDTGDKQVKGKGSKDKDSKGKPQESKANPAAAQAPKNDLDADPDPYGIKNVELVPRCPNCTQEMENEHATICLFCGYNTMTRQWGKTEKIVGLTFQRHMAYLLPAIGAAAFVLFLVIGNIFFATVNPYLWDPDGWMMFLTDQESIRMWSSVAQLLIIWAAGYYCFKRFIEKPKPDDITLD